jgi:hypothetical protein
MSQTGLAPSPCAACGQPLTSASIHVQTETASDPFCGWSCVVIFAAAQEQAGRVLLIGRAEALAAAIPGPAAGDLVRILAELRDQA